MNLVRELHSDELDLGMYHKWAVPDLWDNCFAGPEGDRRIVIYRKGLASAA